MQECYLCRNIAKVMKKFDDKVQMMDAGTALFTGKDGFGSAIGAVKAEMDVYGTTLRSREFRQEDLPRTTKECDLFLNGSTLWRKRYISCKVEDAGDTGLRTEDGEPIRRYAAIFKEGNRSTVLRGAVHVLICAGLTACMFPGILPEALSGQIAALSAPAGVLRIIAGILLILVVLYLWIIPSRDARHIVNQIQQALRSISVQVPSTTQSPESMRSE